MSRIGKKPVPVPDGVRIGLADDTITVEGPLGKLQWRYRPEISVAYDEKTRQITLSRPDDQRPTRALHGLTRALVQNMVVGVSQGYTKILNIVGVGWNAKPMGKTIQLNIGFCHPVDIPAPAGVEFDVEKGTKITITGPDKHAVGQFAANIRDKRRPEPYNGKGILYDGEIIIRKQGKVFGA